MPNHISQNVISCTANLLTMSLAMMQIIIIVQALIQGGGVDRVASHPPQCSPKFKKSCLLEVIFQK